MIRRGVRDPRVLAAMRRVPREQFVPSKLKELAYEDRPLPLAGGQTISQPYIVAYMTEQLRVYCRHRVLEIGTGCGYQVAVLAELAAEVYSIEVVPELAAEAALRLPGMGYKNIHLRQGDGYCGWPDAAPFDRILLTAAPVEIPEALLTQLKVGGFLIAPVGEAHETQCLLRLQKTLGGQILTEQLGDVAFVPMVRGTNVAKPRG